MRCALFSSFLLPPPTFPKGDESHGSPFPCRRLSPFYPVNTNFFCASTSDIFPQVIQLLTISSVTQKSCSPHKFNTDRCCFSFRLREELVCQKAWLFLHEQQILPFPEPSIALKNTEELQDHSSKAHVSCLGDYGKHFKCNYLIQRFQMNKLPFPLSVQDEILMKGTKNFVSRWLC